MNAVKTGKLICSLRNGKNLTQKQLAEQINVSDKAVSKWERGDGCPDVSVIPVLAKVLGVEVEQIINGEVPAVTTLACEYPGKTIKTYDFTRPAKWGQEDLVAIWKFFMDLGQKMESAFASLLNETCVFTISCVDQLNNLEFQRSIPSHCFIYDFDYSNSGFVIEVDAEIGKTLLKQNYEKYKTVSKFDLDVMQEFFIKEINKLLNESLFLKIPDVSAETKNRILKSITDVKTSPSTLNQIRSEMCCLISYEININNTKGWINIQLSDSYMDELRNASFFGFDWKKPSIHYLKEISTKKVENNLFVEIGRFSNEQIKFEVGNIIAFDKKYYEPLNLIYNNKIIHTGEAVVINDKFGLRVLDFPEIPDTTYINENYIAVRIGSCYHTEEEIESIKEKIVLELNTFAGYPSEIIKDGKVAGYGEIYVIDNNFAIKITEVK